MNIVLIGAMGAGKTTVGKILAENLKRPFSDTDEAIKAKHGDISKIFEIMGQEKFRLWEFEAVNAESKRKNAVIATGGGVVLKKENISALKEGGVLFYLRAKEETLFNRLKNSMDRPLLQGDKRERIHEIMQERSALYEAAADFILDTDDLSAEETAGCIQEQFKGEL